MSRLSAALLAGSCAIIVNTLMLKAADLVPLATAHGGLLRLMVTLLARPASIVGITQAWSTLGWPPVGSPVFQTTVHVVVGLLMGFFYAYVVQPIAPDRPCITGTAYALVVWVMNAAVVLPATGEGFAGSAHLSALGMSWFAAAHASFFLILAWLYGALVQDRIFRPQGSPASR